VNKKILIYARSKNNIIGFRNNIPWHLKEDLHFFKEKTTKNIVVMGKNTFDSLYDIPLPDRINVVISKRMYNEEPDLFCSVHRVGKIKYTVNTGHLYYIVDTLEHALPFLKTISASNDNADIYFMGGASIYKESTEYCDEVYETVLDVKCLGDTSFCLRDTPQGYLPWILESRAYREEKNIKYIRNHYIRRDV
jgi:dihydrofolate reductase